MYSPVSLTQLLSLGVCFDTCLFMRQWGREEHWPMLSRQREGRWCSGSEVLTHTQCVVWLETSLPRILMHWKGDMNGTKGVLRAKQTNQAKTKRKGNYTPPPTQKPSENLEMKSKDNPHSAIWTIRKYNGKINSSHMWSKRGAGRSWGGKGRLCGPSLHS